ncbi:condensation domain-containing protein [Dactylosporangium sp. NPDC049742]|uniref:condensation domain-containing protein n=1 Tax=Dactylosporangium sp. NPDC049742 TaxID=3154737 RepID=UPI00343BABA4
METVTSHAVAFQGDGAGVEELTWGQRDVWDLMRRTGRTMNIGGAVRAGDGETVEGVAAVLRFLVGRHQALRTRLSPVDGGPPRQVVSASGEIALEVVDVVDDEPDLVAERLRVRYQTTPFDPFAEWPVRMAVVRSGGTLTHVVVMYYHVVVDGFGINAIVRDLARLDPATGLATEPAEGTQPLDLARQQRAPEALRQSGKSLRYWQRQLLRVPPAPAPATPPDGPRFREIVCVSPALALAVRRLSAWTRVASGPILLAAYAVATARLTGADTAVVQVVVSNRFRPGFADAVGSLRQFGLCVIDVGGPFEEVVARAWSAAIGAYKHGYYDTAAHQSLVAGRESDLSCYLNDRRMETRADDAAVDPPDGDVEAALPLTKLDWGVHEETYDGSLYLHVEDTADAVDAVMFTLWGDTRRYPPEALLRCARDIEAVVVDPFRSREPRRTSGPPPR